MNYVYFADILNFDNSLQHHGILGQKWGIRRFQNADGTYTKAGLERRKTINKAISIGAGAAAGVGVGLATGVYPAAQAAMIGTSVATNAALNRKLNDDVQKRASKARKDTVNDVDNEQYRKDAEYYKKNANDFRNEKIDELNDFVKENNQELSEKLGTKTTKETKEYLMNSMKAQNELDPDGVIFQHMYNAPDLFNKGLIDVKTFSKLYDAQVANDIPNYVGYDDDNLSITKQYGEAYNKHLRSESQEDRLNRMFGKTESVTHYFYTQQYMIL